MCTQISKKNRMVTGVVIALSLMVLEVKAQTIYVDFDATGSILDGSSWCEAFLDLQDAIAAAGSGDIINVADGTYRPAGTGGSRSASFALKNGVSMIGGFTGCGGAGTETILSGDLNNNDVGFTYNTENSYHVIVYGYPGTCVGGSNDDLGCHDVTGDTDCPVMGDCVAATTVLDGFTVTAGNANGCGPPLTQGSGLHIRRNDSPYCHGYGGNDGDPCSGGCDPGFICISGVCRYPCSGHENCSGAGCDVGTGTCNVWSGSKAGNACSDDCDCYDVFCHPDICIDGGPTVRNCTFKENFSANHAAVNDHSLSSTFENCNFIGNVASKGAGMLVQHGSPTISNCTFDGNSTNAAPGEGGGLWLGHSTAGTCTGLSAPTVTDCVFQNNAAREGGGIWSTESDPTISNCTFTNNSGGGGAIWFVKSDFEISGTRFESNTICHGSTCGSYGGAIYTLDSGTTTNSKIINCEFIGNVAVQVASDYTSGGAMFLFDTNVDVENTVFIGNSANGWGGAVGMIATTADSTWTNCLFSGNETLTTLLGLGGAIYADVDDTVVTNCTFSNNTAAVYGGGMYTTGDLTINNSIFWDNTDVRGTDARAQLTIGCICTVYINDSDMMDSDPGTGCSNPCATSCDLDSLCTGTNVIDDDPEFVDADGKDDVIGTEDDTLSLKSTSPCIDNGDNSVVTLSEDLDGNCRIMNVVVDMGAYEDCDGTCEQLTCASDTCECDEMCCSDICVAGNCCEDNDCTTSTAPGCKTSTNTCVECTQNSHCSPDVCDTSTNTCVECLNDFDCMGPCEICTNNQCVTEPGCGK